MKKQNLTDRTEENSLLGQRITWFFLGQTLLMSAYTNLPSSPEASRQDAHTVLPLLGAGISLLILFPILQGLCSLQRLDKNDPGRTLPGLIVGSMFPLGTPVLFLVVWLALLAGEPGWCLYGFGGWIRGLLGLAVSTTGASNPPP